MPEEIKSPLIENIVKQLNSKGIHIDAETVNKAFTNFPQLIQKVQTMLKDPDFREKLPKIQDLLTKASTGDLSASQLDALTKTTTKSTTT